MPKPTKGPRLGGGPAHERLLLANLAAALFTHKSIKTTETKAKRLRPLAERLITFAKRGDLHARRRVLSIIGDKEVVHVLFTEIAPLVADREGGYTRITKVGNRKGEMVSAHNPKIATGAVEVVVSEAAVFNRSETPPFPIEDSIDTREEIRLAHRYLDLRRSSLQHTLRGLPDVLKRRRARVQREFGTAVRQVILRALGALCRHNLPSLAPARVKTRTGRTGERPPSHTRKAAPARKTYWVTLKGRPVDCLPPTSTNTHDPPSGALAGLVTTISVSVQDFTLAAGSTTPPSPRSFAPRRT